MRRAAAISVRKNWKLRFREWREDGPWQPFFGVLAKSRVLLLALGLELLKIGPIRRFWHLLERTPPFFAAAFSSEGLLTADGRTLIRGKFRRGFTSLVPPLVTYLQKKHGMTGGCVSCGYSCKMLFQCPHWDDRSNLCSVYEDRPNICRTFPITPADIRDRDIAAGQSGGCGFVFKSPS